MMMIEMMNGLLLHPYTLWARFEAFWAERKKIFLSLLSLDLAKGEE